MAGLLVPQRAVQLMNFMKFISRSKRESTGMSRRVIALALHTPFHICNQVAPPPACLNPAWSARARGHAASVGCASDVAEAGRGQSGDDEVEEGNVLADITRSQKMVNNP